MNYDQVFMLIISFYEVSTKLRVYSYRDVGDATTLDFEFAHQQFQKIGLC